VKPLNRLSQICLVAAAAQLAVPVQAQPSGSRPEVSLQCVSFGRGPTLDCMVLLQRKDGTPLDGASIRLGALMPSMPMAHTITPINAAPTGKPGEYKAAIELEMPGVWAVEVDISGPIRDKVLRSLMVGDCKGSERCAAQPAKSRDKGTAAGQQGANADHKEHKH
jgi:hypothetical protein